MSVIGIKQNNEKTQCNKRHDTSPAVATGRCMSPIRYHSSKIYAGHNSWNTNWDIWDLVWNQHISKSTFRIRFCKKNIFS